MPFKSKAQMGKMAALEDQGKLPRGTFDKWKKKTKSMNKLPKRAGKNDKVSSALSGR